MTQYDWNADFGATRKPGVSPSQIPHGLQEIPAIRQLSHAESGRNPFDGSDFLAYPYHIEEFLQPGFRALDDAMKQYWSGIRVPTKDSYRFMRVKVAGGDKTLMIWNDDLVEGRARLPLAAIDRSGAEYNNEKYSPPHHAMTVRYLSRRFDQAAKVYRPTPWLVNYKLIIWAEHKRDAEYIIYQILPRFNPLAEFRMFDGKIEGNVQLNFGDYVDASDKEAGFDQHANVRYEVSYTAEAWLPLPEKIVKTVLGRVVTLREKLGQILAVSKSQSAGVGGQQWYEPIYDVIDNSGTGGAGGTDGDGTVGAGGTDGTTPEDGGVIVPDFPIDPVGH